MMLWFAWVVFVTAFVEPHVTPSESTVAILD
jgi:hypothetical protein